LTAPPSAPRAAGRAWIPLLAAAIVAIGCVKLGLWQLDRLSQRKARNGAIETAFRAPPVAVELVTRDSVQRFRRVTAVGTWNYTRETTLAGRTRNGAPGVHILTPMTLADGSTEVLVNRGWVYSPDARTVDLARWREGDRGEVVGYVDEAPRSVSLGAERVYVVALGDSGSTRASNTAHPVRLAPPPFGDDGPHLNYAVQWFSFAAIALIGAPLLVRRRRPQRL
jgi:surfeit locus 1 family protein